TQAVASTLFICFLQKAGRDTEPDSKQRDQAEQGGISQSRRPKRALIARKRLKDEQPKVREALESRGALLVVRHDPLFSNEVVGIPVNFLYLQPEPVGHKLSFRVWEQVASLRGIAGPSGLVHKEPRPFYANSRSSDDVWRFWMLAQRKHFWRRKAP